MKKFFLMLLSLISFHSNYTKGAPSPLKVAILGDSGSAEGFEKNLQMIKEQKADMAIHLGDLAYDQHNSKSPANWIAVVNKVLGESFPYFFLIGNHDDTQWRKKRGYESILKNRMRLLPPNTCSNEKDESNLGIKSSCDFKGLYFILSGIGSEGTILEHEKYIETSLLANKEKPWKICAWHKNQKQMNTGDKEDEVGWKAYQLCQNQGAMIITGHEHAYARTKNLTDLGNLDKQHGPIGSFNELVLTPGKTFVAISGMGGMSMRPFICEKHDKDSWWASIYTANFQLKNGSVISPKQCENKTEVDGTSGILFMNFYEDPEKPNIAHGKFITTNGVIGDEFSVERL